MDRALDLTADVWRPKSYSICKFQINLGAFGELFPWQRRQSTDTPLVFSISRGRHPFIWRQHTSIPRWNLDNIFAALSLRRCETCRVRKWRRIFGKTSQRLLSFHQLRRIFLLPIFLYRPSSSFHVIHRFGRADDLVLMTRDLTLCSV